MCLILLATQGKDVDDGFVVVAVASDNDDTLLMKLFLK